MRGITAIGTLLYALYPLLIFVGLQYLDPRTLGGLLLLMLLARYRHDAMSLFAGLSRPQWAALALPVVLGLSVVATNNETLLLLYPASISLSLLFLFGITLLQPPTLIERLALLEGASPSPALERYTRRVTEVWCLFFIFNGALAAYTALQASRETWAFYNGFVAYLLMGCLFAGERLVRRRAQQGA